MNDKLVLNLNQSVYVRLTERGRQYLREEHAVFWAEHAPPPPFRVPPYHEPLADSEGFVAFQLHNFISRFHPLMQPGVELAAYFEDGTDLYLERAAVREVPAPPQE
ncbi:hypothetical protein [Deinococcus apachensis]|uniref:hypothetical protein n=1 Tax=Deinococcus apachensis TaxID=309886 RepID=UPI000380047F|nr:hypothetical protein [Deinococcus apachensis]